MQFELRFSPERSAVPIEDWLRVGGRTLRLRLVRHRRARRYVLRLGEDGAARVTLPRGGSVAEARQFVQRNLAWLERQLLRQAALSLKPSTWVDGTEIFFRGEQVRLETQSQSGADQTVRFGAEALPVAAGTADLRSLVERHLWRLAARELPARVFELAALHQLPARRVTVRNQRSRWGSCSRRGTISLNWRLVQAPAFVSDYIILHELAHLKEMNHSRRFWRVVEQLCPAFADAEKWLKRHSGLLR
jgi:predicted metal-dependent hydrolase